MEKNVTAEEVRALADDLLECLRPIAKSILDEEAKQEEHSDGKEKD